jgi:hypothetical protein
MCHHPGARGQGRGVSRGAAGPDAARTRLLCETPRRLVGARRESGSAMRTEYVGPNFKFGRGSGPLRRAELQFGRGGAPLRTMVAITSTARSQSAREMSACVITQMLPLSALRHEIQVDAVEQKILPDQYVVVRGEIVENRLSRLLMGFHADQSGPKSFDREPAESRRLAQLDVHAHEIHGRDPGFCENRI